MKKVIQGKLYDSDKAIMVAEDRFGTPGDLDWWYEALYITPEGNYFLYGEGGARTIYGKRVDTNSWTGGWRVTPLTVEEAFAWCQEHDVDATTIETLFADKVKEA